jgi:hypothetical protein
MDAPTLLSCSLSRADPRVLTLTTRGVKAGVDALPVKIMSPTVTVTGVAQRGKAAKPADALSASKGSLPNVLVSNSSEHEPRARDLHFRPPSGIHSWSVTLPADRAWLEHAGVGEGVLSVEAGASLEAHSLFTEDGGEVDMCAPPDMWHGLLVEQGGDTTSARPERLRCRPSQDAAR